MQIAKECIVQEQKQLLIELLHKIALERGITNYKLNIKPTSSEGANFTSALFNATISCDNGYVRNLFAKVAHTNESVKGLCEIFHIENFFYEDLVKTYRNIEEKHNVPEEDRFVTPEFYGVSMEKSKEIFVMEDLTSKGFLMYDRFQKSIDWDYAQEAMKQLAKLHALSMAYSIERPEDFEERTKKLTVHNDVQVISKYMDIMFEFMLPCVKEQYKRRIKHFFAVFGTLEMLEYLVRPLNRKVLGHGDYRPNNLMHKQKQDGSYEVIIVDYQTLSVTNPIVDILFFIFLSSDQRFRAQYYQKTLDCYYSELCIALRRLQLDPDVIYPREQFEFELKKVLPYGLIVSSLLLLMVTLEKDELSSHNGDDNITYKAPSELYKVKLNEVIEDYIQMGVL